jgi:hypothetical protein
MKPFCVATHLPEDLRVLRNEIPKNRLYAGFRLLTNPVFFLKGGVLFYEETDFEEAI